MRFEVNPRVGEPARGLQRRGAVGAGRRHHGAPHAARADGRRAPRRQRAGDRRSARGRSRPRGGRGAAPVRRPSGALLIPN
eukprot:3649332-Prymnesium_polylepis.1